MTPRNRLRDSIPPSAAPRPSPLVEIADPRNVSETPTGDVRVALGTDWPALLRALRRVGPVLSVTRNSHAVIGREGPLPELAFSAGFGRAGDMAFDFRQWGSARVVHSRRKNRNIFAVEWLDWQNEVHHKTCLTSQANLSEFLAWTERHQNPNPGTLRETDLFAPPTLTPPEPGPLVHQGCVEYLLREALACTQPLRMSVGNAASRQTATFVPTSLSLCDQWCFLSGEQTGVHLRTRNLAEVMLQKNPDSSDDSLILKLHDPEARWIAEIASPENADATQWNDFLHHRLVRMPPLPSA